MPPLRPAPTAGLLVAVRDDGWALVTGFRPQVEGGREQVLPPRLPAPRAASRAAARGAAR